MITNDLLKDIGKRLHKLRKSKGYHAKKISRFVGITETMLFSIEGGFVKAPYSVYEDICRALGTSFSEFMTAFRWTYTQPVEPLKNESEVDFSVDYRKVS